MWVIALISVDQPGHFKDAMEFKMRHILVLLHVGKSHKTCLLSSWNPLAANVDFTFNLPFMPFSERTHLRVINFCSYYQGQP